MIHRARRRTSQAAEPTPTWTTSWMLACLAACAALHGIDLVTPLSSRTEDESSAVDWDAALRRLLAQG